MAVCRPDGSRAFPSWWELLLQGAERLEEDGRSGPAEQVRQLLAGDSPNFTAAAQCLRDHVPQWAKFLKQIFDIPSSQIDEDSLALARTVWQLGSQLVVTTNYDRVLEWACPQNLAKDLDSWDIQSSAEQVDMLRLGTATMPTVWHLHGKIRNVSNIILTPDGYERLYPRTDPMGDSFQAAHASLRNLLAARTFLFIGFSLEDEHFGIEFRGVLNTFEGYAGPHFVLAHQQEADRLRDSVPRGVEVLEFEDFDQPLLDLLRDLAEFAPTPDPQVQDAQTENEPEFDVHLAAVCPSLQGTRDRIRRELERQHVRVGEAIPPPRDRDGHREAAARAMDRARISVHLLDQFPGDKVDDDSGSTYPQEQLRVGLARATHQLIWMPQSLDLEAIEDSSHRGLLESLENRNLSRDYELHRGRPSHLAADILDFLSQPALPQRETRQPAVLLDTHFRDEAMVTEVSQALLSQGILPYINPLDDDPRQNLEGLKERLRRVSAVVVFQNQVGEEWVCARLTEAVKVVVNERCPVKAFGIYLGPSSPSPGDAFAQFEFLNFHLLNNRAGFNASTLDPLLSQLQLGGSA